MRLRYSQLVNAFERNIKAAVASAHRDGIENLNRAMVWSLVSWPSNTLTGEANARAFNQALERSGYGK